MTLSFANLVRVRPYVYHLTSIQNLRRIQRARCLESAAVLMRRAGRMDLLRERRLIHTPIEIDGEEILIRDQLPLIENNILFEGKWNFGQLIEHLNSRVFFWPGTSSGAIDYGLRHLGRYLDEGPALIRIPLEKLVAVNPGNPPLLCAYNSGSPRCSGGKKSPRGPRTFVAIEAFPGTPADVVEVTFAGSMALPAETTVSLITVTPGAPLFGGA